MQQVRNHMKDISGFSNYGITDSGSVWSKPRKDLRGNKIKGRWLKAVETSQNYLVCSLYKHGRVVQRRIHHLVLEAYIGLCPSGMECRHLDGNRQNNRLENLCWGTYRENQRDRFEHGTDGRGEKCYAAKLTENNVRAIRQLWKMGLYTQRRIAKAFHVSQHNVWQIIHRKKWRHI